MRFTAHRQASARLGALILWSMALVPVSAGTQEPPDAPPMVADVIRSVTGECRAVMGGELDMGDGAVTAFDMDGTSLWVVDTFHMRCSTLPSLFCGTGGCALHLIAGDTVQKTLSKGWQFVDMDPLSVVLVQRHGSDCGGTNLTRCVEALTWNADTGRFASVKPAP